MTTSAFREVLLRAAPLLALVLLLVVITFAAGFADTVTVRRIILFLVNVVAVVGLYIFMGNSGVLNFSSVGFMAIGGYVAALLTMPANAKGMFLPDLPAWISAAELPALSGPFLGGAVAAAVAIWRLIAGHACINSV